MRNIELISVTHRHDLSLLALQARSIALFFPDNEIYQITIIVNDPEPDECVRIFEDQIRPLYGDSQKKIELHVSVVDDGAGWLSQQAIKLEAVSNSKSEYSLICDAKNHFIRCVNFDTFVDDFGRSSTNLVKTFGARQRWLKSSLKYFDVDSVFCDRPSLPTITPYCMCSKYVKEMVALIEAREQSSLRQWFINKRSSETEFLLYYAFLLKKFGSIHDIMNTSGFEQPAYFRKAPSTKNLRNKMLYFAETGAYMFGLHYARIPEIEIDEKSRISSLWDKIGLLSSELGNRFLNGDTTAVFDH